MEKRRKLMFVLGLAPQKIGGIEKFLRYFVVALDVSGWDTVLCFDGPISQQFQEYMDLPYITIESLNNQGNLGLSCAGELWRLLRKHRPERFVYAFHGVMRCFPWLAKLAGCKSIYFNDHSSRPPGYVARPLSFSRRVVGRFLTAPVTAICSVSDFTRRTGQAFGTSSAPNFVIPNGVEVYDRDPRLRSEFRQRYGISNEELVVTQVCWMVEVKGVDVMLQAAAMLLKNRPGVRFLFVGDGAQLQDYKNLAAELGIEGSVCFTGLLNNPTKMGVFDATDIYCQPSVWQEASGLAVLEAMAVKLPVIASDTGGLRELIEQGRSGLLVGVKSSEDIYLALDQLVAQAEMRRSMGEAGYEFLLKKHRIEDTARKYVELFLSERSAHPIAAVWRSA